ncbi:hypothetical protein GCM10022222_56470 [Amycolatopsis ultiminotia]|uniref:Uncharacterized protein n=1 Tax=Amycolatopsis ultiminotia TaxID=543629 RepID=A0ABP6XE71_9PSEU
MTTTPVTPTPAIDDRDGNRAPRPDSVRRQGNPAEGGTAHGEPTAARDCPAESSTARTGTAHGNPAERGPGGRRTVALRLGVAAVVALVVNTALGLTASALDDGGLGTGLSPAMFLPATLAGLVLGAAGWTLLARRAPRTLRVVVPVVLVLTWIPDLLLITNGATAANVAGLMLMHLAVAAAVVLAMRTPRR